MENLDNIALSRHFCRKETSSLTSNEKLVALVLASHRNNVSAKCNPGLVLLCEETQLSRSTVKKAIKGLKEKGQIVVLAIYIGRERVGSQYYFLKDIGRLIEIYEDTGSVFYNHHAGEVENLEALIKSGYLKKHVG